MHIKCPLTKQNILDICRLIELNKLVKLTLKGYSAKIHDICSCVSQYQLYQALMTISNAKVNETIQTFFCTSIQN